MTTKYADTAAESSRLRNDAINSAVTSWRVAYSKNDESDVCHQADCDRRLVVCVRVRVRTASIHLRMSSSLCLSRSDGPHLVRKRRTC